jgi:hypothetical protein
MTTDMENELRELFREKAAEAPIATPGTATQRVLRRGRLHQAGTVLGSMVVVAALIVGSVAGVTSILEGEGKRPLGSGPDGLPSPSPSPSRAAEPVEPIAPSDLVHGGTYWAVYPWVGAAGSAEADDVSVQLLAEFGIEAGPGELACDQGAAEALGTDAEHGIGVYFETEDEANEFALQAGLLDHTNPVIAHVTTYCLD